MIYPKVILTAALIFISGHFIVGYHKRGIEIQKLQEKIVNDSISRLPQDTLI
jgi:hypothetical protein